MSVSVSRYTCDALAYACTRPDPPSSFELTPGMCNVDKFTRSVQPLRLALRRGLGPALNSKKHRTIVFSNSHYSPNIQK